MYLQTGDVLYKKIDKLPSRAKKLKGNLIHKGQNHHHTIRGRFELLEKDGKMFINVKAKSYLEHEEHSTLEIQKGFYEKDIVEEYDHFLEESRAVID